MPPIVLFSIQFSLSLLAYALIAVWYVAPALARRPRAGALVPLLWVHAFRIVGGAILAPGAADPAVPDLFRSLVGLGDLLTAVLALVALVALRIRFSGAIALAWLCVGIGLVDTVDAIVQSLRFGVLDHALGVNWLIVTSYVPALLVSSVLIVAQLRRPQTEV